MVRAKRKKKKPLLSSNAIIGIFIVVLMMGSGMGLMLNRSPNSQTTAEFNGYEFSRGETYWQTEFQGNTLNFQYLPDTIEELNISSDALNAIRSSPGFYVTYNPGDEHIENIEVTRLHMERTFGERLGKYVGVGVTENKSGYGDFPVITCENATANVPVVHIRTAGKTGFEYSDNCLYLNFEAPAEVFMLRDRLVYGVTGIIQNG